MTQFKLIEQNEKAYVIQFENGQKFKLNKEEVEKGMKTVKRNNPTFNSKQILMESLKMVCEDNDILENLEQKTLVSKGSGHREQGEKKSRKAPTRKANENKLKLKKALIEKALEMGLKVTEEKEGEFQFDYNKKHYTIRIIEQREKKE